MYQYNEGQILNKYFAQGYKGFLVEIGAADGEDNSNSYELIKVGWSGLLVEPHPQYFFALQELYKNCRSIQLSNYCISSAPGRREFWLNQQCSSLVYKNGASIFVECVTLDELFSLYSIPKEIDFLSIDAEGEDMNILKSLTWTNYNIKMVCVEHSMSKQDLYDLMSGIGYQLHDSNIGNSFFTKKFYES